MSRQADEKNARRKGANGNSANAEGIKPFWSFHPTVAEKEVIKGNSEPISMVLEALEPILISGVALKVTRSSTSDSFAVVATDTSKEFGQGQALACFHADLETALRCMLYVLTVKHPDWPIKPAISSQSDFDW